MRVEWWRGSRLLQAGEVSSMHKVRAYESRGLEQGLIILRHLSQQAQQQKGDQRDGDLNPHGILGAADEMGDFQGLLQNAEEQFDLPSSLVEVGDFFGGRVQIIGQNPQGPSSLHRHDDLAHRDLHRIFAVFGLASRNYGDGVDGAPTASSVPRWLLSKPHLKGAVHGQVYPEF